MAFDPKNSSAATDAELLRSAATGEAAEPGLAVDALYRRHGTTVYRYAWLLTGSEPAAADVLQETFLALLAAPAEFDPTRGSAAAHLCGIVRHLALRGRQTRMEAVDDIEPLVDDPQRFDVPALPSLPSDEAERARAVERLYAAIRLLPPHFRDVLMVAELQQFSYADTAAIAGVEIGTVRSRLSRAKARLLELLAVPAAIQR
jgi:RNA polymerase sigma-70 factor (ECF subfamily)